MRGAAVVSECSERDLLSAGESVLVVTPVRERGAQAPAGRARAKLNRKKGELTSTSTVVKYLKPNVKIFKYAKIYIF